MLGGEASHASTRLLYYSSLNVMGKCWTLTRAMKSFNSSSGKLVFDSGEVVVTLDLIWEQQALVS